MIGWKRAVPLACPALVGFSGSAFAQVQGQVVTPQTASAYPADWQHSGNFAGMFMINNAGQPITCFIQALLLSREGNGSTAPSFRAFNPGPTFLQTPVLADWPTLAFYGNLKTSVEKTGHLPDGTYTLTIHCLNIRTASGQPIPDFFTQTTFVVSTPQPPSLLYPQNESAVTVPNPVFQWTPAFRASGTQPAYRFRIVELLRGQTALRAIEANYPLFEINVQDATALPYPVSVPPLLEGRTYAWRVQAIEPPASLPPNQQDLIVPVGANEGRSQVFTFTWRTKALGAGAVAVMGGLPGGVTPEKVDPRHGEAAPAPRWEDRKNFADRLVEEMVARWDRRTARDANRAAFAGARRVTRAGMRRALSGTAFAAAYDSISGAGLPADTTAPSVAPPSEVPSPLQESVPPPPAPAATAAPGFGPDWLKLHGGASLSGEAYSRNGTGSPTRPFQSGRLTTGLSFGLMNDRLRVPLNALLSGDQVAFRQNINQVGLSPRFRWAGLNAGNFVPQYSSYSLADATVLGAGLDLTPKKWRLGFATGRMQKAIAAAALTQVQPQFARNVIAGRLGYGDPTANTVEVSVMRAKDDKKSLADPDTTLITTPESNTVYALTTQGVLPRMHLRAQVEGALSQYAHDQRANYPDVHGHAVGVKLFRETALSQLGASFELLGGGFVSLGNSAISNDRWDWGATGRTQLYGGKLTLGANLGWRKDNVSRTLLAETKRKNYSVNAAWLPRPNLGADLQFGFTTSDVNPADSVATSGNISRVLGISPHVSWVLRGIQQTLTTSATIQSSSNTTSAPVPLTNTHGVSVLANWSALVRPELSLNLGGNYTRTDMDVAVSEISNFGPGFTWAIPGAHLATTAQLQLTRSRTGNSGTDTEFAPRCEMRWQTTPHHAIILHGNFRRYRYTSAAAEFNERLASIEYAATL